jgi:chromosome segregation ATPase
MKQPPFKKVSMEDLAIMVQRGFNSVDKRFDGVDDRFDALEKRVDSLDKSMFEVKLKLESVDERLESIEKTLGPLVLVVEAMKTNWKNHEMRIAKIERALQTK